MGTQHLLSRDEQAATFKRKKHVKVVAEDQVVNVQMAERVAPLHMAQEVSTLQVKWARTPEGKVAPTEA